LKPSGVVFGSYPKANFVAGTSVPKIFSQREANEKKMREPQDHFYFLFSEASLILFVLLDVELPV